MSQHLGLRWCQHYFDNWTIGRHCAWYAVTVEWDWVRLRETTSCTLHTLTRQLRWINRSHYQWWTPAWQTGSNSGLSATSSRRYGTWKSYRGGRTEVLRWRGANLSTGVHRLAAVAHFIRHCRPSAESVNTHAFIDSRHNCHSAALRDYSTFYLHTIYWVFEYWLYIGLSRFLCITVLAARTAAHWVTEHSRPTAVGGIYFSLPRL